MSVVCCQVEVSASGWSLVQRSLTEFGVSECDHESSAMSRPSPTGRLLRRGKKKKKKIGGMRKASVRLDWDLNPIPPDSNVLRYIKYDQCVL
jgi:hypothetical protein